MYGTRIWANGIWFGWQLLKVVSFDCWNSLHAYSSHWNCIGNYLEGTFHWCTRGSRSFFDSVQVSRYKKSNKELLPNNWRGQFWFCFQRDIAEFNSHSSEENKKSTTR